MRDIYKNNVKYLNKELKIIDIILCNKNVFFIIKFKYIKCIIK